MKKTILFICLLSLCFWLFTKNSLAQQKNLRIVSLAPSTTEILFALGLEKEIIAVSQFCNYPKEALSKPKAGTFSDPNIEIILSLKPDIIFCTGLEQAPIIEKLKQLNLNVYVSDPKTIEDLLKSIEEIGRLTQREKEASHLVSKMKQDLTAIQQKTATIAADKKPKVFIEIWHDPLLTAGKGSFIDEMITYAGGTNIAHDTIRPFCCFSPEQVINRNPDIIIIGYMDKRNPLELIKSRPGWQHISAVIHNRIYDDIDPNLYLRPGPRIVLGIQKLYEKIHS
ncbi:MAG: cobalamin-binding protein [Candidatus Omnitrophota bacterium]